MDELNLLNQVGVFVMKLLFLQVIVIFKRKYLSLSRLLLSTGYNLMDCVDYNVMPPISFFGAVWLYNYVNVHIILIHILLLGYKLHFHLIIISFPGLKL